MKYKGIQQEYAEIDQWVVRPAFAGLGVLCAGLLFAFCDGALGITPVRRWFTALHPRIFMFFRNAWGSALRHGGLVPHVADTKVRLRMEYDST